MLYRKLALLLLPVAAALLVGWPLLAAGDQILFVDVRPAAVGNDSAVSQAKDITINWSALNEHELTIELFSGETVTAVRERKDLFSSPGSFVWVGHLQGDPQSSVTLSVIDQVMAGSIYGGGYERYRIRSESSRHLLQEIDHTGTSEVQGPDIIKAQLGTGNQEITARHSTLAPANCEDGSQIDLLVAYTAGAVASEGSRTAVEALINQRVSEMNSANINSGLPFRYHLAKALFVDYEESGDVRLDLTRLQAHNDGYLDEVHLSRDTFQADMVSLMAGQAHVGLTCGVGYLLQDLASADAGGAFNVAALDYAGEAYTCSPYTLAHEFGHNMGNRHERSVADGNAVLPFAYGYQSPQTAFRTIMAYNCDGGCPRINHWSNPQIDYHGEATGLDHGAHPQQSADNARAMLQTAKVVANFRADCPVEPAATPTAQILPTFKFNSYIPHLQGNR